MTQAFDKCKACQQNTLKPWNALMATRRCANCGEVEERDRKPPAHSPDAVAAALRKFEREGFD